jgi:hypothetical protein
VVYNLRSPSGQKILRAENQKPETLPTDCANIYRMPNPRAPPVPADLPSAKQQLRRRQAGQAELVQAARRAAQRLQQRFRRAPQTLQKGKMRTRTPKDVRIAPAPLRTSPTPVGPTASGETPSLPQTRPAASICRIDGLDRRALPRRQHAADADTDRSAARTACRQPAQTRPATGGPPPEKYHRPNGNDGSRHHGAAASSVSTARRSAHANDDRSAGRPTVPRTDASPAAPTP